jgi:hypothetical protein
MRTRTMKVNYCKRQGFVLEVQCHKGTYVSVEVPTKGQVALNN